MKSVVLVMLNLAAWPAFAFAPGKEPPPIVRTNGAPTARLTLSADGESLLLDGPLEQGVAAKFKAVIEAAPNLRTIVLQSDGGRLGEAIDISEIVHSKGLDTYVESWCASACTIILLAGRDRAASPSARIGFHQPIFPTAKASDIPTLRSVSRRIYDNAGVQPTFTDRAFATPASGMWFPSSDELQAAHVLTRISLSGETSAGVSQLKSREDVAASLNEIPFWPALKRRYPDVANAMVEEAWRAKEAGLNDNDVSSAGRAVLIKNFRRLLAVASDELLAEFLDLVIDQGAAARALSFEACDKAFKGQLNIYLTLPKALTEREFALIAKVLEAPAAAPAGPPAGSIEALLGPIFERLPADQLEALSAKDDDYSKPARCDGMMAFLREIRTLPAAQRSAVTRSIFLDL